MPTEYTSKQIWAMSEYVDKNYEEPERSQLLKKLSVEYVEARTREEAARHAREEKAQINRLRSLYDRSPAQGANAGRTRCHVCDGRGEYTGRTGRRACNRCYGKGYI